mmetsp:Transcript_13121/g.34321  ORF Transcript_13121/g.34321 Transcript_13121/m.34321 type:complete len:125 (+) Transcript_13121:2073-2447(+)
MMLPFDFVFATPFEPFLSKGLVEPQKRATTIKYKKSTQFITILRNLLYSIVQSSIMTKKFQLLFFLFPFFPPICLRKNCYKQLFCSTLSSPLLPTSSTIPLPTPHSARASGRVEGRRVDGWLDR